MKKGGMLLQAAAGIILWLVLLLRWCLLLSVYKGVGRGRQKGGWREDLLRGGE